MLMILAIVCCCCLIGYFAMKIIGIMLKIDKLYELENEIIQKEEEIERLKDLIVKLSDVK